MHLLRFEPYYELPMGISKLWALVQFRLGCRVIESQVRDGKQQHAWGNIWRLAAEKYARALDKDSD